MIAALSVRACAASRLELLLGLHPEECRWLPEEEGRALLMLKCIPPALLENCQHFDTCLSAAKLWHHHFPELTLENKQLFSPEEIWDHVMADTTVRGLGYVFYPAIGDDSTNAWVCRGRTNTAALQLQDEIEHGLKRNGYYEGKVTWTLPFPAAGPLGKKVETRAGLTQELKHGVGLGGIAPGLLYNYCYEHAADLPQCLSPRQFEELVASVYSANGWQFS
jgi:hypothetical protein